MRTTAHLAAPCPPAVVFDHVAALDRYPAWMGLVHRAVAATDGAADGAGGTAPAWDVELRTRVGPLARSKRLRMVRTVHEPVRRVVFERREVDGRDHAPWVLVALVEPDGDGCRLTMDLSYGGSLWTGGVLQRILDEEIRRASERLLEVVSRPPTP